MCAFVNNGHIKVKLLIVFLSTEGKPAVFGFSFSVMEQFWFLSVCSKWEQNEQEMKLKLSHDDDGDLSWCERQVF